MATIATRVARIAEAELAEHPFVAPVDVLIGLGWLAQANVDRWLRGRIEFLDLSIVVDRVKVTTAVDALNGWARAQGLTPHATDYRGHHFTESADPTYELMLGTWWVTAEYRAPTPLPEKPRDLMVESPEYTWECDSCEGSGDLLIKTKTGVLCLDCADLGHLVFLPAGDAALTRRARKASRLSAVVVRWNRRRKHYERQGVLVESEAVELAARECLNDADARALRRTHDQARRAVIDDKFRDDFADAIGAQFPGCPRADSIAHHAALKGSGRVGRSAAGRALDPDAIRLAVAASVRHLDTDYDELMMSGVDRDEARHHVRDRVDEILAAWRDGVTDLDA